MTRTTLLSCTSGLMVSWTMNQVAFLRMKAVMRFQWMMFLRQRMLLRDGPKKKINKRRIKDSVAGRRKWLQTEKKEERWQKNVSCGSKHVSKLVEVIRIKSALSCILNKDVKVTVFSVFLFFFSLPQLWDQPLIKLRTTQDDEYE